MIARLQLAPPPSVPPPQWSGAWVRGRLREAFDIDRRLPGVNKRKNGTWPPIVHSFADLVGWRDLRARGQAGGVPADELTRMEQAFGWLEILARHPIERQCLEIWARSTGSLSAALERRAISRATFYRRVEDGSNRIASVLNQRGIQVR